MTWANKINFFLICVTIVLTTLAYGAVHQPIIAVFYLTLVVMAVLWGIDSYLTGAVRFSRSLLQAPIIAAAIYGLVQVIPFGSTEAGGLVDIPRTISVDPFATQVSALHFFALFIFFGLTLVYLETASRLRTLAAVITVFGFAYAFFAILQSVLSPDKIYGIYESAFASPFGSFVNRHNFAAYMEMTIAVPLGLLFAGAVAKDKRLLYVTAIALMGVALLLSGSRGGLVALLAEAVLLIFLTTRAKTKRNVALKAALAAIMFLVLIGGTIFVGGESSLTRIAETATSRDITTNRMHIWQVTMSVITNNLPLGAGLGAFGVAYTQYDSLNGLERVEQAHNDYLQVLSDAGLLGLIICGFFVYLLFRTGWRNVRAENAYRRGLALGSFAGIFAILVHSIFDFVLHTTAISVLFLSLVAMLSASGRRYDDDIDDLIPGAHGRRRSKGSIAFISERRRKSSRR